MSTIPSLCSSPARAPFASVARVRAPLSGAFLLATTALASVLFAAPAHAFDATWGATPGTGDFNTDTNWVEGAVPSGTAKFATSTQRDVSFSTNTEVEGISVAAGAGDYSFDTAGHTLFLTSTGLVAGNGAHIAINNTAGGSLEFLNGASAGESDINNASGGGVAFLDGASAGQSSIDNAKGAILLFEVDVGQPAATAGQATISNHGLILFDPTSTAADSSITSDNLIDFFDNSNAGRARITNDAGGTLNFFESASAAQATISNHGLLFFNGLSTAADSSITSDSVISFIDGSSAGRARITNNANGVVSFSDGASAAQSTIVNHGQVNFRDSSTAENSFITSDGGVSFFGDASGGKARIALSGQGVLDISQLTTDGTTVGSIEGDGGVVTLGSKNLIVGGNNRNTSFAGAITGDGSLTKEGRGNLTLTGVSAYTGATTITAGALTVDGTIALSSVVTVQAGGTLAGIGSVGNTNVDGGTLASGHADGGTLTVRGDLAFHAADDGTLPIYLVRVLSENRTFTHAGGTADLAGNVKANFSATSLVTRQITILTADGGVSNTFGQVSSNLSPIFSASLSYDPNHVFLNVAAADAGALAALNVNQRNVGNGIVNAFNANGSMLGAFATLQADGLTQVSGETAVGSQQVTFDAMNQFMGVLLDPTVAGRSAATGSGEPMASMSRKAPVAPFSSRWGVWAAGYGGSQSVNGDSVLGSNKTTSTIFGSAVGADYYVSPNTMVGFALAGGGTHFNVANGGSVNSDLFQAGGYLRHTEGAAFIAAALAYGWQDVKTDRTVTVAGADSLRGRFNTNAFSARLEGGYKFAGAVADWTPYAAAQFTSYHLPSYTEEVGSGVNTFALAYDGKDVATGRTELGMKTEKAFAQADSLVTLRGRLAWAHDYNTDRNVQAAFVTLPGSAFVVNGAKASADSALTSLSAETLWHSGWAASVSFDGQFSDTTRSYAGKGVVRYNF